MAAKTTRQFIRTQERPEGRILRSFRVRCSRTLSFYVDVEAYSRQEAEFIAEDYCVDKGPDVWKLSGNDSAYSHIQCNFEAEED